MCALWLMTLVLLYNFVVPQLLVGQLKDEHVLQSLIQKVVIEGGNGDGAVSETSGLHAKVTFMQFRSPVNVRVPDTTRIFVGSYGYMDVPPLSLTGGLEAGSDVTLVVPFVVTNASAFGVQVNDFMTLQHTTIGVQVEMGSVLVTSWDIPVGGLSIDDTVVMNGLDSLAASTMTNISSNTTDGEAGLVVGGDLEVCNTAKLAAFLPYGVRFGMYVEGYRIGVTDLDLLDLRNGCFSVPVNGTIETPSNATVRAVLGRFLSRHLSGDAADVQLLGESVIDTANRYRPIPPKAAWLHDVVRQFNVTHAVPGLVGGVSTLITSMRLLELGLTLNNHTAISSSCETGMLVNVTGELVMRQPDRSFLNVTSAAQGLSNVVVSEGAGGLGALVGQLPSVPPVSSKVLANNSIAIVASWTMQHGACGAGGASAVGSIISRLFAAQSAMFSVRANAHTNLTVQGLGKDPVNVNVSDMSVNLDIPGLNGLQPPNNPVVIEADVYGGNKTAAFITGAASLNNPTSVSATIADGGLEVDVYGGKDAPALQELWLGRAFVASPLTIKPGMNNVTGVKATLMQSQYNGEARRTFLSMFARGITVHLTLHGGTHTSPLDVLAAAFPSMSTTVELPPIVSNPFISFVQISASWDSITHGEMLGKLTLDNPFSAQVTAFAVNMKVYHKGTYIGHSDYTLETPVSIAGHTAGETPWLPINVTGADVSELWALVGDIQVSTNGTISLGVGEYVEHSLYYAQSNIPASIWHKGDA